MELKYYKRYCKDIENVENYEKAKADDFKNWQLHHRLETNFLNGERRDVDITSKELITLNMYYDRPASELVFLTKTEHVSLHFKGRQHTEETKKKLSKIKKGESNGRKGTHHTMETRKKMSEAQKGHYVSEEARKKMSETHKGKLKGSKWYNDGKINKRAYECPEGFVPGRLK